MTEATQESMSSETAQTWDASDLESALAHIERLQDMLDGLRSTMPSLVAPLVKPSVTKAQMFADIKKSAVQSTNDIQVFKESWTSERTQQILTRGKDSLEKNGDLSKADEVPKYGWSEQ